MIIVLREHLWSQFGASIDMLKNAITMWPEELWTTRRKFFYMTYHCLFFLDYYLTIPSPAKIISRLPFTIREPGQIPPEAIDDIIPDRIYTKQEILEYLESLRERCRALIASLTEEGMSERWIREDGVEFKVLELHLYNMRHVQHHAAQLNMLLRQEIGDAPGWVRRAGDQ